MQGEALVGFVLGMAVYWAVTRWAVMSALNAHADKMAKVMGMQTAAIVKAMKDVDAEDPAA